MRFDGADITRASPEARAARGIARTFQITNLFFGLSVEENLLLATRGLSPAKFSIWRTDRAAGNERNIVDAALSKCHLESRRDVLVREISYGEQRQLELAMSLTSSPKLLLLDEPAAGLSPAERVVMANVIRSLPRELSLVLIEHDIDLALGLVDRVICMYQGTVLVEGKPDEIRAIRAFRKSISGSRVMLEIGDLCSAYGQAQVLYGATLRVNEGERRCWGATAWGKPP